MKQYDFTLKFLLSDPDADPDIVVPRLDEAGCDDALLGIGKRGQIALSFSRDAESAEEAVLSALHDVKTAIPDATFLEAAPDFVGVPDIAKLVGVSRQYVRKLVEENAKEFPPEIFSGARSIWHLEDVLLYCFQRSVGNVNDALLEVARTNMRCNQARVMHRLDGEPLDGYLQATA